MDNILKEIYKGEDLIELLSAESNTEIDGVMDNVEDIYGMLHNMLDGKAEELLKNYKKAWEDAKDVNEMNHFVLGVKLGGRLATSMLHEE